MNAIRRALGAILFCGYIVSPAYAVEIADSFRFPLDVPWHFSNGFANFYDTTWCGYHLAEDAAAPSGTPVFAAAHGMIGLAQDVNDIGGAIHIIHTLPDGSQVVTIYYHLRRLTDGGIPHTVGAVVHKGDQIGDLSARPEDYGTGPHLHFGVRPGPYKGTERDPRTQKWFYPGYTAIYRNGLRQCDSDPVGDRTDPIHQQIVAEWVRPTDFLNAHLLPPPTVVPTFASRFDLSTGVEPLSLVVADLDGDHKADIAVTIYNHGNGDHLTIFRNVGSAAHVQFDPLPIDVPTGTGPEGLAAGDLNNDGKIDLVVANPGNSTMTVLRNFSTPGFMDFEPVPLSLPSPPTPHRVVIADFDHDGLPDIIVASNNGRFVSVFHHASDPNTIAFDYRIDFGAGDYLNDLAVADIDGDLKPEILVPLTDNNQLTIFQNTSSPGSVQASALPPFATGTEPRGIAVADLNNDHALDVVVAEIGGVAVFQNASTIGSFSLSRTDVPTGTNPDGVAIGDLVKDGLPDVVVANSSDNTLTVLHNTSSGDAIVLTPLQSPLATGLNPINVVLGDVDGDGWLDIVTANHDGNTVSIFVNTSGSPQPTSAWLETAGPDLGNSKATGGLVTTSLGEVFASTNGSCQDSNALGVFRSTDQGNSWSQVNLGLDTTNVFSLAVSSGGNLFAGAHDGIYRYDRTLATWEPSGLSGQTIVMLVATPAGLFAADSCYCRGLYRSTDEGATWQATVGGLPPCVNALVEDTAGNFFAGTGTSGVFELPVGATAWQAANGGLATSDVHGLALDAGGNLYMGGPAGLFRLSHGATQWQQLTSGLPTDGVQRIAFGSGSTAFVGTFAHGIYVSQDSGATWTADNSGLANATTTVGAFAKDNRGFLYGAVGSIVYRSATAP